MEKYWHYNSEPEMWLHWSAGIFHDKLLPFHYLVSPRATTWVLCSVDYKGVSGFFIWLSQAGRWGNCGITAGVEVDWPGTWEASFLSCGLQASNDILLDFSFLICMWQRSQLKNELRLLGNWGVSSSLNWVPGEKGLPVSLEVWGASL